MRITFLCFIPILRDIGGIQKVTDSLTLELQRRGHEVSYVHYEWRKIPEGYQFSAPQHYIDTRSGSSEQWVSEYRALLGTLRSEVVVCLSNDAKAVLFLSHTPEGVGRVAVNHLQPFAGFEHVRVSSREIKASSLRNAVLKYGGMWCPSLLRAWMARGERRLIGGLIDASDRYVVLCEPYIDRIASRMAVDRTKMCVIPNPSPYSHEVYDGGEREHVLLYLGRLSNYPKNLVAFIRVWQRLEEANPGWRAMVVGSSGILQQMKDFVEKLGLKRLTFEGHQRDVRRYYRMASIVCVTSFFEAWNMSLIEGQSFGCVPVAFSSYEATGAMIDDGVNGLLVTPFDEREMAEKIQQLINDPETWSRMSREAKEKSARYSIEAVTDQWENLFRSL